MEKLIETTTLPERPDRGQDVYGSLVRAIVGQQLSGKAAATIYGRFLTLFEQQVPHPDLVLACTPEELRAVGLSGQKAGYIQNVARYFLEGHFSKDYWQTRSDAEIIRELTAIKGVGEWTVQMLLMFTLRRPDVFPINDLVIRRRAAEVLRVSGATKREMSKNLLVASEVWAPYRTVACLYLWASA